MCVLVFSTTFSETFLILRRIQWVIIINVQSFSRKLPVILADCNETWIFRTESSLLVHYTVLKNLFLNFLTRKMVVSHSTKTSVFTSSYGVIPHTTWIYNTHVVITFRVNQLVAWCLYKLLTRQQTTTCSYYPYRIFSELH